MLLPGAVLPAQPAYGALIEALGTGVEAFAKDLELYAGDEPPPGWSLDTEIEGVLREADARGWGSFHLAGYSGGGAAFLRTFRSYGLDRARLASFDRPVLFVLGGLSNPDHFGESASRLSKVPERLAGLLREHWDRAESRHHAEIR